MEENKKSYTKEDVDKLVYDRVKQIKNRIEKATKGPWHVAWVNENDRNNAKIVGFAGMAVCETKTNMHDQIFLCHVVEDVDFLLKFAESVLGALSEKIEH